jgi:CDP-paratose 2-epimerase
MKTILITGGAGFIGINAALEFSKDHKVTILDNLSKKGSKTNLKLADDNPNIEFVLCDISSGFQIDKLFEDNHFDIVLHLAAQTAVTISVENPRKDFYYNVHGTFNILEAMRKHCPDSHIIYASTNKVYGNLNQIPLTEGETKYTFTNEEHQNGVDESTPLDLYSPYGCSKGAADQYVLDYNRIYGLKSTALRQSCIYGIHQNGTEDQGWIAWFMKAFLLEQDITIYGNGKQVRDALYVSDLVSLYRTIAEKGTTGAFNVGGGIDKSISLLETIDWMKTYIPQSNTKVSYDITRPGDQMIFVSDNTKLKEHTGWEPTTTLDKGLFLLLDHLTEKK